MSDEVELVPTKHISVDCVENDRVDINCGGPRMLGYDFNVSNDMNEGDIRQFLIDELKKNGQPLKSITITYRKIDARHHWTKERIAEEIKRGY